MTENKRFGMVKTKVYDLYVPVDEMNFYIFPSFEDELDCIRVVNALNDLEEKSRVNGKLASQYLEEIEQLKSICQDHRDHAIDFKADCVRFEKENEELKVELNKLEGDLDYYKTKCASLETGLLQAQRDVEWVRDNTVWEQMPSSKRTVTKTFK